MELTHQIANDWNKTNMYKDNDLSYVSPDYRPYRGEPVYWYEPISVQLATELKAELEHNGNAYGHYKKKAQGLAVGHN